MPLVMLESETKEGLEKKIDNYIKAYHPAGYGTQVEYSRFNEETQLYEAQLWRAASCD